MNKKLIGKDEKTTHVNSGRRERMRTKLTEFGANTFLDHEILEMLLYNVYKREDTNKIAHNLLSEFGGIKNMLIAPVEEVRAVEGVGDKAAEFLALLLELYKRMSVEDFLLTKMTTSDVVVSYLRNLFMFDDKEKFYVLFLDAKHNLIKTKKFSEGDTESLVLDPNEILKVALNAKAKFVLLAHNHMVDSVVPSSKDIVATKLIVGKLLAANIEVLDHFILAKSEHLSFKENGIMRGIFEEGKQQAKSGSAYVSSGGKVLKERIDFYLLSDLPLI
ncbi:MAG: hypothetical protein FWD89_01145 [Firmicutes bacterium]|nr:hypothetical protein [Bacillota bacterium]MCL2770899.1 hypothetical protein [Bacillota bacterium]